ncbi:metal-dependent hydrolase [Mucilaginibacter sp. PPCGB 2223]|uniref:DinB family protein n=1 Tax=Mucilaginibacter sp. PPCGB 2223 TaxID=1886027 RepID=UPI000824B6A0|nr:DinB family protein [Mucilaginibacter sp. PPCGB 2223]OCX53082.1 metal-dependent hydrolase [Mucilaginibacter sp. PPCGB 2223]
MANKPEVWQRGPVDDVPALLQPVAHALLQAHEETEQLMRGFPDRLLWESPANMASPAFHLEHMRGVLDRLFTYARAETLNDEQLNYLRSEGKPYLDDDITQKMVAAFGKQVNEAIGQLKRTDPNTLTDFRGLGRAQIPTTVIGLLFHAAEHVMRHAGQLLVTVKVLSNG